MSSDGNTFEIHGWLEELGLSQYADAFTTNDIEDERTVSALDETDLEKLGVASPGHRKKFMTAIEELRPRRPDPVATPPQPEVIVREVPVVEAKTEDKSGCTVWQVVGVLLVILLVIVIGSAIGL
jgi:hypothetical protein